MRTLHAGQSKKLKDSRALSSTRAHVFYADANVMTKAAVARTLDALLQFLLSDILHETRACTQAVYTVPLVVVQCSISCTSRLLSP